MATQSHSKLLAPFMVMALLSAKSAAGVTPGQGPLQANQAPAYQDRSAMTGQLLTWGLPPAGKAAAPVKAPDADAAAVPSGKGQAIGVDDLIAKGAVTFDSLIEAAPAVVPAPVMPKVKVAVKKSKLPAATEVAAAGYQAPPPKASEAHAVLTITATAEGLVFSPEQILLPTAADKISLKLAATAEAGLQLFVRNQKIAELNAEATELSARRVGTTELYAVANGRMYIIPVRVSEPTPNGPALTVPTALLSLNGVVKAPSFGVATYAGVENATASAANAAPSLDPYSPEALGSEDLLSVAKAEEGEPLALGEAGQRLAMNDTQKAAAQGNPAAPSLKTSIAETAQSLLKQAADGRRFYNAREKIGYVTAQVQLIDDRSIPSAGVIYPVAGVNVRVLGTEYMTKTDATGHLSIKDMPRQARFMLRIDDPNGQYRAAIAELSTADLNGGVLRLRVMRNFAFDALTTIVSSTQQSSRGSYCGNVTDKNSEGRPRPVADVSVQPDVLVEGPYYFNAYGFLDRALQATGPNGRFCFFNAPPGPLALSLAKAGSALATIPVSIFANRHVEDDFNLAAENPFGTQLASMATAQEQLSSDLSTSARYQQVDMIDLVPLGTETPLPQVAPGRVALAEPLLSHQGRIRAYARAAEFEPVVYTYKAGDEQTVTPLIPRGFVEDMSLNAQVVHDPELGTVLAEYAAPDGATQETISMRLVDQDGHDVGDGWYFSDAPATKALFFNVPAGTYSLQVQTRDGYWLNSDTVIVYSETMSFMRLGNNLRYRP